MAALRSGSERTVDAGHLPQIEQPAATLALIDASAAGGAS
jgi:hypothetical protein